MICYVYHTPTHYLVLQEGPGGSCALPIRTGLPPKPPAQPWRTMRYIPCRSLEQLRRITKSFEND